MSFKHWILLLMFAKIKCFQNHLNVISNSECILRVVNEYFVNSSTINFIIEYTEDAEYIHDVKKPHVLVEDISTSARFILYDFVVHGERQFLKRFLSTLPRIQRLLFITKGTEYDVRAMFHILWEAEIVNVLLLINNPSPMLYSYRPLTGESNCGKTPLIISKGDCNIKAIINEHKPISNFYSCEICHYSIEIPYHLQYNSQLLINKKVMSLLANTLNSSIVGFSKSKCIPLHQINHILPMPTFDYIQGVETDEFVWIVPKGERLSTFQVIAKTYDKITWILILIAFILVFLFWCLFTNFIENENEYKNHMENFLMFIQLTLSISLSRLPRSSALRFIVIFYTIYSLHICALFGANLVNILTIPKYDKGMTSVEELAYSDFKIATFELLRYRSFLFSATMSDIQNLLNDKIENHLNGSIDNILQQIKQYRNYSLLIRKKFAPSTDDVNVLTSKLYTNPINLGFARIRGSCFTDILNTAFAKMRETGILDKLSNDISTNSTTKINEFDIKLSLDHLLFAFILLLGGLLLASFSFLFENLWWRYFDKSRNAVIIT